MEDRASDLASIEDYVALAIRRADEMLTELHAARDDLVFHLHGLRIADDPALAEAETEATARIAENRPYEDTITADELAKRLHRQL